MVRTRTQVSCAWSLRRRADHPGQGPTLPGVRGPPRLPSYAGAWAAPRPHPLGRGGPGGAGG
jgi:hypothetical protein